MLKVRSIREMTREELEQKKNELLDEQFKLNMRRSVKALDNPLRLRHIRREIAKINTILNEDKQGIAKLAEHKSSILDESKAKDKSDNK